MHQLAKREVCNQKTHKKEMNIEEQVYSLRRHGAETQHGHDPFLDLNQIHLEDEPHEDSGERDPSNHKKYKVVRGKRDILNLRVDDSSQEEIGQGDHNDEIADVKDR